MKKLLATVASACALAASAPASATTFNIDASSGFALFGNSQTTTGTGFSDTFNFNVGAAMTFVSGLVGTHRLRNTDTGQVVSDLDINSVTLDNKTLFTASSTNTDIDQDFNLASTKIDPGSHFITVNYNVDLANRNSPAGYSGNFTLAQMGAVPEPASWAMMVGGFGLLGFTMRSKKRSDLNQFA